VDRRETGKFFESIGKMGNTAVMHLAGNFGEVGFVTDNQLFYPFDLMGQKKKD